MDTKRRTGSADGQAGIELSHHSTTDKGGAGGGDRQSQPGLEVVDYSSLEVVSPRPGLSHARTWEKGSSLPQVVAAAVPYGGHHPPGQAPPPGSASSGMGTPYSGLAPSYEYMSPHGGYVGGGGGGPPVKDGVFREDSICGVKRQTFWIVIAIGIFVMVAAVAIGVGLGVALHRSDDAVPSTTPLPSANSSSPTTTSFPLPTATGTTGPEVAIRCPANNRTLYSAAGTGKSYLLLCGRDYSSVDGAVDLSNEPVDNMSDCIARCARQQGCVGAGWGPYNDQNTCWLKSVLGLPNVTPNWYFAVEDEGALGT